MLIFAILHWGPAGLYILPSIIFLSCVYYASCDPISCQLLYRGWRENTENNIFDKLQQVYGNNFPKKSCCASIGDEIFWSLCSNLCSRVKSHVAPIYCGKYG